jgi:predicted metal-binding protein
MNVAPSLYICVTCPRDSVSAGDGHRGRNIADAAKRYARERGLSHFVRSVECLMGCPTPCNAALRTPGKATIRFSRLGVADVPALFEIAARYAECEKGDLERHQPPPSLREKLADKVMPLSTAAKAE